MITCDHDNLKSQLWRALLLYTWSWVRWDQLKFFLEIFVTTNKNVTGVRGSQYNVSDTPRLIQTKHEWIHASFLDCFFWICILHDVKWGLLLH